MENDLSDSPAGSVNTLSLAFAEGLYADYLKDPNLVRRTGRHTSPT